MKELIKAVEQENKERYKNDLKQIKTQEGLQKVMTFYGKTYKGNDKEKTIKFLKNKQLKELDQELVKIQEINQAEAFKDDFVITIEWKKSQMWGSNPRAYTSEGFEGESIGGCGYCKLSTATAQALNSNPIILKLLYLAKNKALKKNKKINNREALGYGSGYNILPSFEGGVGVSSHERILGNVGLTMKSITSTKTTDVYLISKGVRK